LKREIVQTKDGSTTIYLADWNESYHSKHGAIQEAYHVFIKNGLTCITNARKSSTNPAEPLTILEIGFGTGLNAFISYLEAIQSSQKINYVGIEAFPIPLQEVVQMNYAEQINPTYLSVFKQLHDCAWEQKVLIDPNFLLTKRKMFFQDIKEEGIYDLIYFDAFGFRVQPELWSEAIFKAMYMALKPQGVLVTYACRTSIKNAMLKAGFSVEKLPGAPGKREMLRAIKNV
jgi:tRNA U34 5-methylaminomethyl-2-thiouridine-forming methyltransferase MnmC